MADAQRSVDLFCPVPFTPVDYIEARSNLVVSAGLNNPIYQTVLEANIGGGLSTTNLTATLERNLDPTFIIGRAFAFVLLVVLLIIWIFGCWCFVIPCCMRCCCRCCEVHHVLGRKVAFHVFLWISFLLVAIGCIVAQAFSFPAYHNIDQGRGILDVSIVFAEKISSDNTR